MARQLTNTIWDLSSLFSSPTDPQIAKMQNKTVKESYKFINKWKNRSDYLEKPASLAEALNDFNHWLTYYGLNGKVWYYFDLLHHLNQNDSEVKARMNKAEEVARNIQNDIQFFELNIAKIEKSKRKKFLNHKALNPYKNFLKQLFSSADHLLSDNEEKIMNLKANPAHSAWVSMVSGLLSKEEREVLNENGKTTKNNFEEILGLMDSKQKEVRDSAAEAFNGILKKHIDVVENEINAILLDKKVNDTLRKYDRPDKARHIGNDIDTEVVDALRTAVSDRMDIARKYYALKAKLFGVKKLAYHERNLEYGKVKKKYSYSDGVSLVTKTFHNLDPEFAEILTSFQKKGQVDVYPKKGKQGGAFCIYNLITQPVFVLLNWTDKLNDVRTLAHEFGHAINDELTRKNQIAVNFGTSTATAEVASTFMEDFVLEELEKEANDEMKLTLKMAKLNQDVSSIFRQIAFYNFEWDLHQVFRDKGYLSQEEIGNLFQKHMKSYMGSAVEQSEGSQNWWSYVWHFRSFFYVYSYASGLLISKSLQASVRENKAYVEKVKVFFSAGVSKSPKDIFADLGVDITNKAFWHKGLDEIEANLKETEKLAKKLGKI